MTAWVRASRLVDRSAAQVEALIRKHGSVRAAAKAVGLPKSTLHDLKRRGVAFGWRRHFAMGLLQPARRRKK